MNTPIDQPANTRSTFSPPQVITPQAFHLATGGVVGLNRIYELLRARRIRHVRIGNRYLILAREITEFFVREADSITAAHGC